MIRVTKEWPIACEHNLTESALNRRAWLGHAAACLAIGSPEYITRQAWWMLTQGQRDDADAQANGAIQRWIVNRLFSEQFTLQFDKENR